MINFRSVDDMNKLIKAKLHTIPNVDCIIGVPRSGMLPATLIALYLGKPLISIEQLGSQSNQFTNRISLNNLVIKKALVVDDSCFSGNAMNKVREYLKPYNNIQFIYSAIYVTSASINKIDLYFDIVEQWRVWEWNIMDHLILESSCVDLDGILCVDPTYEQNDDGDIYLDFLCNATPKFIPTHKIKAIVTCRLEKYRMETELWLKKHNVKYNKLYMMNLPTMFDRQRLGHYGEYKGRVYNQTGASLFIESNPKEAEEINLFTGKPVYCLNNGKFYKEIIC